MFLRRHSYTTQCSKSWHDRVLVHSLSCCVNKRSANLHARHNRGLHKHGTTRECQFTWSKSVEKTCTCSCCRLCRLVVEIRQEAQGTQYLQSFAILIARKSVCTRRTIIWSIFLLEIYLYFKTLTRVNMILRS